MKRKRLGWKIGFVAFGIFFAFAGATLGNIFVCRNRIYQNAAVLLTQDDRYGRLFAHHTQQAEQSRDRVILLCGNQQLGVLHVEEDTAAVRLTLTRQGGIARLAVLAMDTDQNTLIYDAVLPQKPVEITLKEGYYRVDLVGQWFTGTLTIDHPATSRFIPGRSHAKYDIAYLW